MLVNDFNSNSKYIKYNNEVTNKKYLEIGDIDVITKKYELKDKPPVKGAVLVPKNVILISTVRPNREAITITREELYVSSAFAIVNPNENIDLKYLFYCLNTHYFFSYLTKNSTGATYPTVNKNYVYDYSIPYVSIEKQQEIVSILDKINAIIDADKKLLDLLDETVKSRFIEMFEKQDFPLYKLCDITYKITDGKHGGCNTVNSSDFYFVGAREIYDNKINYKTAQFITESEFIKDYKRCNLEIGDFIIVNTGATIGKSAIVSDSRATRTLLQKSVAMIKPNKKFLLPIYLKYIYDCHKELYIVDNSSAQPNLLLSKIKATEISVPPIELQNEFATFIEQIDKLKFNIQQHLDKMQELLNKKMDSFFDKRCLLK